MINRRQFIKTSASALAMTLPVMGLARVAGGTLPAPGVQLFTFFATLDNDVKGTLKQASDAGIRNIESAFSRKGGYYGMTAKEFGGLLNDLGMSWRSHHVFGYPFKPRPGSTTTLPPMKNLTENLSEIIDDAKAGGVDYLVAAHLPIGTTDEIKASLDLLNQSAGPIKKAGLQLVYHNEPADFKAVDGQIPYDTFLSQTDVDALKFELDIAWALKGGTQPETLINKYPGRFPLWHVKDISADYETVFPVGEGTLDYQKYFGLADKSGLKYYFIEHENPKDAIASIKTSVASIQSIKL